MPNFEQIETKAPMAHGLPLLALSNSTRNDIY
jgi:hypothetical protein